MQQIFSITKFSRYLTASSYSTYFSWKKFCFSGQRFYFSCSNWQYCRLGTKNLFHFLLTFFHQLIFREELLLITPNCANIIGMINICRPPWGGWRLRSKAKMRCCQTYVGGQRVFCTSIFFKKIVFALWADIMLSQTSTGNLPFNSDVIQWSHSLLIPLHCLCANRTIERVVNLNVKWLDFVFVLISFIHIHDAVVVPSTLFYIRPIV